MYAGLTISDKTALLNAKQAGHKEYGVWLEEKNGWKRMVTVNIDLALAQIAEMESAEIHHKMLPSGMDPITMTNDHSREICENYTDPIAPKTNRDVLLERWAKDTRKLAEVMLEMIYDSEDDVYVFEDGFMTSNHEEAIQHMIAYLNSAVEVEK